MLTFDGVQMAITNSVKIAKDRIASDKRLIFIVGGLIVGGILLIVLRKKG